MIYLLDTNGFKAISPTPNGGYGDISVDPAVGVKVKAAPCPKVPASGAHKELELEV
jgi:hypothetical protein